MKIIYQHNDFIVTKSPVKKAYMFHAGRIPVLTASPPGAIELADAIYKAEGVDLHAQLAAVTAERDRLREALENLECDVLHKIDDWANAYPVDVFIEPTKEDWQKRNAILKENGLSPDAFSGSIYRHCLTGMQKHIKKGMEIISALREPTDD